MKKYACQYAIAQFLPYTETGEFANIGIVIHCADLGYFDYKILPSVTRITAFFDELNVNIYKTSRNDFKNDLNRFKLLLNSKSLNKEFSCKIFNELTRPREAIIRFNTARTILCENPSLKLQELFSHYVFRSFATKEYQEKKLEKNLRSVLNNANLARDFTSKILGNDQYHVHFPFVKLDNNQRPTKIIKPLFLAHEEARNIYDHGWAWVGKINRLKSTRNFSSNLLLTVNAPNIDDERFSTYSEVKKLLQDQGAVVVNSNDTQKILAFAK